MNLEKRELPVLGLSLLLFWLLGMRTRVRVCGQSMEPALGDGSDVLVRTLRPKDTPALIPGDILWLTHPLHSGQTIIKRLQHITDDGGLYVVGDAEGESSDSRVFGPVPPNRLLGLVVARFPPP